MFTVHMRCCEDFLVFKLPIYNEEVKLLLEKLDNGYRRVWWVTKNAEDVVVPQFGYNDFEEFMRDKYEDLDWNEDYSKEELDKLSKMMNVKIN